MKCIYFYVLMLLAGWSSAVQDEYEVGKKLPADAFITCPDSNPLRAALRPVPVTAVSRIKGWSLWDL